MKTFIVCISGGRKVREIAAKNARHAANKYIAEKKLIARVGSGVGGCATITKRGNYTIASDYVVFEA